ncbi:MAG: sugar transferase [Acidobacteria bacterium]|nr:sugar transferase [Acidobacteriota bacterium]MBS1864951.1 sugar transferase [Acidobacteriota bacterium]
MDEKKRTTGFAEKLVGAVSSAIRESDIIGWYEQGKVLGVIYTELNQIENLPVADVLEHKIQKTFKESLDRSIASKIVVSLHVFPESREKSSQDEAIDEKLYPEDRKRQNGRKIAMFAKRFVDLTGSLALLLVLAPVMAAIALAIKLGSKGPVIFRQQRVGQFGKRFDCLKFRTMTVDNDPKIHQEYVQNFISGKVKEETENETNEVVYKIKDDPRVTAVGRFLRKTSLDELPQFWNVLTGEMSLVGPRPPVPYEFEAYDLWHQRRVLEAKPGVTGLWQVIGRSRTTFDEMVRLDLRYCQRWSLWLDIKILLATPLAVFKGSGAC